ncbi:hypothetical protein VNI00_007936 [Paramarasmius palmivorus]|uniref:Tat pathway signal sequence n=1 Tax=Paramarasmius palmivorus TaxID=297713 RepID=A0AAW0CVJ9_9AGAR
MFKSTRIDPKHTYFQLTSDEDHSEAEERPVTNTVVKPWFSRRSLILIIVIEAAALLWALLSRHPLHPNFVRPNLLYSPAQDAVEYHITKFAIGGDRRFHIRPSDELDAHWESLYNFGISRVPKSQAALLPNKTVTIPGDEDHYIVELDVFHNLHCLNMIRKTLHSDYYTHMAMNLNDNAEHMDHCVDWLRQSLMCAGDTSVIVWKWEESEQKNKFQGDVAHTCRDFDKLRQWGLEHTLLDRYDPTIRMKEDDIVIPVIYDT